MSHAIKFFQRSPFLYRTWRSSQLYAAARNFSLDEASTDVESFDSSRYRNEAEIRGTVISEPYLVEMPSVFIAEFNMEVIEQMRGNSMNIKVSAAASSNSNLVSFIMQNIEPSQLVEVKGSYRIKSYKETDGSETKYHNFQSITPKSISIIKSSNEILTETEPALSRDEIQ